MFETVMAQVIASLRLELSSDCNKFDTDEKGHKKEKSILV